jgi:hypothetical protein
VARQIRGTGRKRDGPRDPDPAKGLDQLLADLCEQWGICTKLTGQALLQQHPALTPLQFARAVLSADGLNPDKEPAWVRRVKRRFESWRSRAG